MKLMAAPDLHSAARPEWAHGTPPIRDSGVPRERIARADLCTASHPDLLPSYRRDGKAAGRIAAAIISRRP